MHEPVGQALAPRSQPSSADTNVTEVGWKLLRQSSLGPTDGDADDADKLADGLGDGSGETARVAADVGTGGVVGTTAVQAAIDKAATRVPILPITRTKLHLNDPRAPTPS